MSHQSIQLFFCCFFLFVIFLAIVSQLNKGSNWGQLNPQEKHKCLLTCRISSFFSLLPIHRYVVISFASDKILTSDTMHGSNCVINFLSTRKELLNTVVH